MSVVLASGLACDVELEHDGQRFESPGRARLVESVLSPTVLTWAARGTDFPDVCPGDPVTLRWRIDESPGSERQVRLWCLRVRREVHRGVTQVVLVATDALGVCGDEVQLRSHRGGLPLARLVEEVVRQHAGTLRDRVADGASPTVALPWLLQGWESGDAFVRRVARDLGVVPCWRGDHLEFVQVGAGGDVWPLDWSEDVHSWGLEHRLASALSSVTWTDGETLEAVRLARPASGAGRAVRGAALPLRSCQRPGAHPGAGTLVGERGEARWAAGSRWDLELGLRLQPPGGGEFRVNRIEHVFETPDGGAASYTHQLEAVPPSIWGTRVPPDEGTLLGPLLAEVVDSNDPRGQGRVRVRLREEPEGHVSSWIACTTALAAEGLGVHCVPDPGSLVLLVAPGTAPERLFALGTLRGSQQRIPAAWRRADNTVKAMALRGLTIEFDERKGELVARLGRTSITVDAQGIVRVRARQIRANVEDELELRGGRHATLSFDRIDLG